MSTTGAIGQRLSLRLFIEGIEVPVVSATVQANLNSPATASIQIVPSDRILEFKARTMVHLFFYDYTNDLPDEEEGANSSTATNQPIPLSNYCLLFGGDVVGLSVAKTPTERQSVLQCVDWSSYWDSCYQMMVTYGPNGNFLSDESSVWAGGSSIFNDIIDGHSSVMNSYLNQKPLTPGLEKVKGLMGGIISLLEAMGGVPRHTHGVNDFFTIAELRTHLLQQITAEQNDDTAQRLFSEKEFMAWLERGVTSLGELVTFRDMLKLLFKWIYYESVPITSPMYVAGTEQTTSTKKVKITSTYNYPKEIDDELTDLVRQAKLQAQGDTGLDSPTLANEFIAILGRIMLTPQLRPKVIQDIKKAISFATNITGTAKKPKIGTADPKNDKNWKSVADALNQARTAGKDQKLTTTKNKTTSVAPELNRLQAQVFRPDCFFASPPRCNVLFPEQVTQFQYSRNFLQEVTRLRLQTGMAFIPSSEKLLASYHYAPAMEEIRDLAKKQGVAGVRALLPWEKFSGILPKFELVSEVNYIANKREKQIKKDVKGQAINYAQRAANFNYLKYRFAARSLEISAKFNPFMVCGFPALYIDKPFILDPDQVTSALEDLAAGDTKAATLSDIISNIGPLASAFKAPTQYLGMVASLTHQVSQGGGTTSVAMTHARSHRITEDDFLQIFSAQAVKATAETDIATVLDAQELISKGDYKKLKFLIDATPQDAPDQAKQIAQQHKQASNPQSLDPFPLVDRPQQNFSPSAVKDLAPLFKAPNIDLNSSVSLDSTVTTNDGDIPLRGLTQSAKSKANGTEILVPAKGGVLKTDGKSKGPADGQVSQIQVAFDGQIMAVSIKGLNLEEAGKTGKSRGTASATKNAAKTTTKSGKKKVTKKSDIVYVWRRCVIHETVKSGKVLRPIPVEEALRPPWFSPLYSNMFIGDNIYQPFFGTGALVDEQVFQTPFGTGGIGPRLKAADGDLSKIQKILSTSTDLISDIPSIETSADSLAYLYGEVRRQSLDVHRFVADYTKRPIATIEDIFGSQDLAYKQENGKLTKTAGVPGFHSSAVGPYNELVGLLDNPDQPLPRLSSKGQKFVLSKELDPRPERRAAVKAYVDELLGASGTLGIGLPG